MKTNNNILDIKDRIKKLDKKLLSFITFSSGKKIKEDVNKIKNKNLSLIGIKDNIAVEGLPLTAASKILSNFKNPLYNATCVQKIQNSNKYINIGKLNMDEFAMGSTSSTSYFGEVKNPYDESVVPGGSSGGSAVAVASNFVDVSLGTDTGGSVRQPSSFTNTIGFKPTYGRISRFGVISFASTLDQVGIFSKKLKDCIDLFEIIYGRDKKDLTTSYDKFNSKNINEKIVKFKKIAVLNIIEEDFNEKEVIDNFKESIEIYKKEGFLIEYIDIKNIKCVLSLYDVISNIEAYSNLSRYDGIRYGYSNNNENIDNFYEENRSYFGQTVKNRLTLGKYILLHNKKIYIQSLKIRNILYNEIINIFNNYDAIITPTSPILPFNLNNISNDKLENADIYTVIANIVGIPAISVPSAFSRKGLPIGLQILTRHFNEELLFFLSKIIEDKKELYKVKPRIYLDR